MSKVEHFSRSIRIERPAAEVFAWHERPGALARLCPPWENVQLVSSTGGVRDGARVTLRNKVGPFWTTWKVEHRDFIAGQQFRDVLLSGPFARWEHLHRVVPEGPDACTLIDEISYQLPGGPLGRVLGGGVARRKLQQLFSWRHATTKADLEVNEVVRKAPPMRVLIAGASGMIGQTLIPLLQTQGHRVIRLVRRAAKNDTELFWDPSQGQLEVDALEGIDAIVNLSGENIAGGRWTDARREAIFASRVDATRTLVAAMQQMTRPPRVFVSASAVGFYGDRGDDVVTEDSGIGHGFLPEVCLAWETHADGARTLGVRTAIVRFGVVLSPAGGALGKLLPIFKLGAGGPVGGGAQWMSWIGIDDAIGAINFALCDPAADGVFNLVAPVPVT
ncbi:MAG: TIGR01777 family oxidoreductase, partial [Opitutus sp.]